MKSAQASSLTGSVLKALGVFGGVQVVILLCAVIRTKAVAIWLGPVGVGLFGIFSSASELLGNIALMGMGTTATRELAAASAGERGRMVLAVRRMCLTLAVAGCMLTVIAAPWLSEWAFGSGEYTWGFRLVALSVFVIPIAGGESGIMQGMKRYAGLARGTLFGGLTGLVAALLLFYFAGLEGVVPSVVLYTVLTGLFVYIWRVRRVDCPPPGNISWRESLATGGSMLKLGGALTVSLIAGQVASYVFLAYLNRVADTSTVGFFQAGFTVVNRYAGVIFMAMIVEFFPRLSSVCRCPRRTEIFVSHEMSLILSLLTPLASMLIAAGPLVVTLLYSEDFHTILPFIYAGMVGTILRASSFVVAYVILARSDGKVYVTTELVSSALYVGLSIGAYHLLGFNGLGIAYFAWYLLYMGIVWSVYRFRYRLRLRGKTPLILWGSLTACAACWGLVTFLPVMWIGNIIAAVISVGTAALSIPTLLRMRRKQ